MGQAHPQKVEGRVDTEVNVLGFCESELEVLRSMRCR